MGTAVEFDSSAAHAPAAAPHASAATRPAARTRLSPLQWTACALLVAALVLALLQLRQFALWGQAQPPGADPPGLSLLQLEADHGQLREQWRAAIDERTAFDAAALQRRYAAWAGQARPILASGPSRRPGGDGGAHQRTFDDLRAFVAQADAAWAGRVPTRAAAAALLAPLDALAAPLHALSAEGMRSVFGDGERRAQSARRDAALGLALALLVLLLTLAFAAMALRRVHRLKRRGDTLEDGAAQLRGALREADGARDAKTAFVADMSHEIREPFHHLMGMLSLLRESGLTPRQIDHLRTATEAADRLLALLNDIVDMSQLESGRMTLAPAATDLRAVLRDVESRMRPRAHAKSLPLHVDADPGVPERALVDATRVKQIVLNLLSNAVESADRGAVVLDLRCPPGEEGSPGARLLEFTVTAQGHAARPATQSPTPGRLGQEPIAPGRRRPGTGPHFELSRTLARLMGGEIDLHSQPGDGSRWTFRMPLQPATDDVPRDLRDAGSAPSRPLRVLVADDHAVNREYIAALLDAMGHTADFTTNGREAVQALQAGRHDLVLMDLHMPVVDGLAATREIRALPDPAVSTVPIFALTADALDETRERCLVAGMNDFLTKPVSPQKLATSLRRLFGCAGPAPMVAALSLDDPGKAGPAAAASVAEALPLIDVTSVEASLQAMPASRLGAMIDAFLQQAPETARRLRTAVRDAQPLELRVNAHAAKGAALNLGLARLAATAQALQEGAAHLPAHEIARLVQRFEDQLRATRRAAVEMGLLRATAETTR